MEEMFLKEEQQGSISILDWFVEQGGTWKFHQAVSSDSAKLEAHLFSNTAMFDLSNQVRTWTLLPLPPWSDSARFQEDLMLLMELQLFATMPSKISSQSNLLQLLRDGSPDFFSLTISGLKVWILFQHKLGLSIEFVDVRDA